ncbi:hypothetical protein [Streptomyces sp. NPDC003034]
MSTLLFSGLFQQGPCGVRIAHGGLLVEAEHLSKVEGVRALDRGPLPRLAEIEKDLILRRRRAEEEQWLGEIEGIDMTLTFVRTKQADAARLTRRTPVTLGILPTTRQPE